MPTKEELQQFLEETICREEFIQLLPQVPKPSGFFARTLNKAQLAKLTDDVNIAYTKIRTSVIEALHGYFERNGMPEEWPEKTGSEALDVKADGFTYTFDLFAADYTMGSDNKPHVGLNRLIRVPGVKADFVNEDLQEALQKETVLAEELKEAKANMDAVEDDLRFAQQSLDKEENVLFALRRKNFGVIKKTVVLVFLVSLIGAAIAASIVYARKQPTLMHMLFGETDSVLQIFSNLLKNGWHPAIKYPVLALLVLAALLICIPGFLGVLCGYGIGHISGMAMYGALAVFAVVSILAVLWYATRSEKVKTQKTAVKAARNALKEAERRLPALRENAAAVLKEKQEAYDSFADVTLKDLKKVDAEMRNAMENKYRSWQTAWLMKLEKNASGDAQR